MSGVDLFDPDRRGCGADYRQSTPLFEWLETDSRPAAEALRKGLESWLREYPHGQDRDDLRSRLSSRDDDQHRAALLELWTHEVLRRLGYAPAPHPLLPTESRRRPDFATTVRGSLCYVECAIAFESPQRAAAQARQALVIDMLSSMRIDENLSLYADFNQIGSDQPPIGELREQLAKWASSLDLSAVSQLHAEGNWHQLPRYPWRHRDWDVEFRPVPLDPSTGEDDPPDAIGVVGGPTYWVTTPQRIRTTIRAKQQLYGDPQAPLVLVVSTAMHATNDHLAEALFGGRVWSIDSSLREVRRTYARNGAWRGPRGIAGRRVSGVLFLGYIGASNLATGEWTFTHHPDPIYPVPAGLFPFARERSWVDGRLTEAPPARTLASVLGLDDGWPGWL